MREGPGLSAGPLFFGRAQWQNSPSGCHRTSSCRHYIARAGAYGQRPTKFPCACARGEGDGLSMSAQLDSGSTRASRPRGLIAAVALVALVLGSAMFVASLVPQPAAAHEDPANCDQSGLGTVLGATPSGTVQVGDVITYTVTYTNSG